MGPFVFFADLFVAEAAFPVVAFEDGDEVDVFVFNFPVAGAAAVAAFVGSFAVGAPSGLFGAFRAAVGAAWFGDPGAAVAWVPVEWAVNFGALGPLGAFGAAVALGCVFALGAVRELVAAVFAGEGWVGGAAGGGAFGGAVGLVGVGAFEGVAAVFAGGLPLFFSAVEAQDICGFSPARLAAAGAGVAVAFLFAFFADFFPGFVGVAVELGDGSVRPQPPLRRRQVWMWSFGPKSQRLCWSVPDALVMSGGIARRSDRIHYWFVAAERMYGLPAGERDRLVVVLRARGWSLARIAARVGMSRSGVLRALERIDRGDPGVDRRDR